MVCVCVLCVGVCVCVCVCVSVCVRERVSECVSWHGGRAHLAALVTQRGFSVQCLVFGG